RWFSAQRRPNAVMIYAGHNEFLARFAWDRNVRHYVDEGPEPQRVIEDLASARSWFGAWVVEQLERNRLPVPPPERVTRELVDHPTCTPRHRALLRSEYGRLLDEAL